MKTIKLGRYSLIVVLLIAAVVGSYVMADFQRDREGDEVASVRHTFECLDPEMVDTEVSKTEAIKVIEKIGYEPNNPEFVLIRDYARDKTFWEIDWVEAEDLLFFDIDAFTGEILAIFGSSTYESKPEEVSLENAYEIARQKIEEIGEFPAEAGEPSVEKLEEEDGKVFYKVFWEQKIEGIPVVRGFMSMTINPAGNIRSFSKCWQNITIDTKPKITEEEAIEIARQKASLIDLPELLRERIDIAENIYANLVIKKPFHPLDENQPIYGEYSLIWEVIFENVEEGLEPTVSSVELSIDAHSGELVGMDFTM